MLDARYLSVLRQLATQLHSTDIEWAFAASMGAALQGLPFQPRDIDIQTDENGAYEIERCFEKFITRPVKHSAVERVQSHYGSLTIDGIEVEIMGALQTRELNGPWSEPVDIRPHRTWVQVQGLSLPVMALEHEVEAYRRLGRTEKADRLQQWLTQHRH